LENEPNSASQMKQSFFTWQ